MDDAVRCRHVGRRRAGGADGGAPAYSAAVPPAALRHGVLSTDAYQLTMAQLYLRAGLHERRVRFEHFFRSYPDYGEHRAGYCVAAGLGPFARWITSVRSRPADVDALRAHRSRRGQRLFDEAFCSWLRFHSFMAATNTAPKPTEGLSAICW